MINNIYNSNGLVFWNAEQIKTREYYSDLIANRLIAKLKKLNKAFESYRIEAPCLIPNEFISNEYDKGGYFQTSDDSVSLRPETTGSSYAYAQYLITSQVTKLPLVVWQLGKSFRREQDKTIKNMRLKEFYQLEFQVIYSIDTKADYPELIKETIQEIIKYILGDCRLELSDRLPHYSDETTDVIYNDMEICSMSKRNDFPNATNFEVAIGMDRILYQLDTQP